jgi:hypothetical protein
MDAKSPLSDQEKAELTQIVKDLDQEQIERYVSKCRNAFRAFGGGRITPGNPISHALANDPPSFAAGVDIHQVVSFILALKAIDDKEVANASRALAHR